MQVSLYYQPHKEQKLIHASKKRFKIIVAGRRSGKTLSSAAELINHSLTGKYDKHSQLAWIAPTYAVSDRGVDAFKLILKGANDLCSFKETYPKSANFINGVSIKFLSADNPDSLRGLGLSYAIIDEADYISDYTYYDVIRPTLADHSSPLIAISTPKRKNSWFHKLFLLGKQGNDTIDSFHLPSSCNPFLPKSEIDEAQLYLPQNVFRREWLAEWVDEGGEVFQKIDNCIFHSISEACQCKQQDILGIDLAKHNDFTVIITMCSSCGKIKNIKRFNTLDWVEQKSIIKSTYASSITPIIYLDSTGVGDVVYDDLQNDGLNIVPFKFNNTNKQQLINNLRLKIMNQEIMWYSDMEYANVLKYELESYEVQETPSGKITYNGIQGIHDDTVIALALAAQGLNSFIGVIKKGEEEKKEPIQDDYFVEKMGYDFGDSSCQAFF